MSEENKFRDFVEKYRGTVCLNYLEFIKLLNFTEDDDDYYYIIEQMNGLVVKCSCVATMIGLKGTLEEDDYKHVAYQFARSQAQIRGDDYPD